jgi:hypothetical protein
MQADDTVEAGEFNVWAFFANGDSHQFAKEVDARTAVDTARRLIRSLGAQLGTTVKVIITDGGDCTNFEWAAGYGIVFPAGML